jgi:hypothetical protein
LGHQEGAQSFEVVSKQDVIDQGSNENIRLFVICAGMKAVKLVGKDIFGV